MGGCVCMARISYGLSFLPWAVTAMDKKGARHAWLLFCMFLTACCGLRALHDEGSWRYWAAWTAFHFLIVIGWFLELRRWPEFLQLMFNLDGTKYYSKCEVRDVSSGVKQEGSLFGFHPHGILSVGFGINGMWSKRSRHRRK